MFKLYWDDELAKLAQAHSNLCAYDHDFAKNRISPDYHWLNGQTMMMAHEIRTPLAILLDAMFRVEKPNFQYGRTCKGRADSCINYAQIMLKDMTRVGCGHTHCLYADRIERFLTCNYIHSLYVDNVKYPYTPSKLFSNCFFHSSMIYSSGCLATGPGVSCKKREGNLCDCGNKICNYSNAERIDPASCECVATRIGESFQKRADDVELTQIPKDGELLEANPSGGRIEITADGEAIVARSIKRSPRKYSQSAQNENKDRITIFVR